MENLFEIIEESDDLLVVNKPAGLVCHPTKGDRYSSLISRVRLHLGPEVCPHFINRLDRETSGVVLLAKNLATAVELRRIWETRLAEREYLGIVHGHVPNDQGQIDAPLGKDEKSSVAIKNCVRQDGASARTGYRVELRFIRAEKEFSFVRVYPCTGRKHQIRIHLASVGHPIVGDKLYGSDENLYLNFVFGRLRDVDWARLLVPNHALHAASVRFNWRRADRVFQAKAESWFTQFCGAEHEQNPCLEYALGDETGCNQPVRLPKLCGSR